MIFIKGFECGPVATIAYLVADEVSRKAIVIDASRGSTDLLLAEAAQHNVTIEKIILTHTHWDHIADAHALKEKTGAPLLVHRDDEYRLADPTEKLFRLPFTIPSTRADAYLADGDVVELGSLRFLIIHTPGHTEGGIALYEEHKGVAFVGDTLFAGSIGRTDLPGGDTETLLESIRKKLFVLPENVCVYPGHGLRTTIGREKESNPFARAFV